jgi:hypothetical protein
LIKRTSEGGTDPHFERRLHGRILSTDDRDFNAYRWKRHEPFENLLFRVGPAERG